MRMIYVLRVRRSICPGKGGEQTNAKEDEKRREEKRKEKSGKSGLSARIIEVREDPKGNADGIAIAGFTGQPQRNIAGPKFDSYFHI